MELKMFINNEELARFCELNDFIVITDEILSQVGMYKNLVYATDNNFVGVSV